MEQPSPSFFLAWYLLLLLHVYLIKKNIPLQSIYKNIYKINFSSNTVDHEADCRQWLHYGTGTMNQLVVSPHEYH